LSIWERFYRHRKVSGDVCIIHFILNSSQESDLERLWGFLKEIRDDIKHEMNDSVKKVLGREFEIRELSLVRGSIEIWVVIAATAAAISGYGALRQGVDYLISDLRVVLGGILRRVMPRVSISAVWYPGPAILEVQLAKDSFNYSSLLKILVWYLVLSNAFLMWTLWKVLRLI